MISKDEIEQMRKYYQLSAAISIIDTRPKNIVLRILPEKPNPSFVDIYHTLTLDAMFGKELTTQEMESLLLAQEETGRYNEERGRLINAMQFYCKDQCNMTNKEFIKFIRPYETDGTHEEIKKAAKQLSDWYKEEVYTKEYQKNRGQR